MRSSLGVFAIRPVRRARHDRCSRLCLCEVQLPHQKTARENGTASAGPNTRLTPLWVVLLGLVLIWICSTPKPNAVLGRLSYFQFWLSVALAVVAAASLVIRALPERRRRGAAFRLIAVLLGLLVALAVGELVVFLLPVKHQMDNPWYLDAGGGTTDSTGLPFERPPYLKWEGVSRGDLALLNGDVDPYARRVTFETDMEGFRNSRDISQADLITIGDSFTEAGNVMESESFTVLAGKQLGLSTRNLGRAGYTTATELIVLKNYGLKCQPRIIVWQVAEANDLVEMQTYTNWIAAGRPRYFDVKPRAARFEAWQNRSPTCRFFSLVRDKTPWPLGGTFKADDGIEYPVRFFSMPSLEPPARGHPAWPAFSEALIEGAALCSAANIRLLVLLIPTKSRVMAPHSKLTPLAQAAFDRPESEPLGVVLKEFCDAHRIPFVDATGALRAEAGRGRLVYLPYDTHLSPQGHVIVADLISRSLSSQ